MMRIAAALAACATLGACANMSPEDQQRFWQNFQTGLRASQPVYYTPQQQQAPQVITCQRIFADTVQCR